RHFTGLYPVPGPRPAAVLGAPDAGGSGERNLAGLAETAFVAQSGDDDRRTNPRSAAGPSRGREPAVAQYPGAARNRQPARREGVSRAVSAADQRGTGAAGADRDGDCPPARATDCRRANQRTRHPDAGGDFEAVRTFKSRTRDEYPLYLARSAFGSFPLP